MKFAITSRTLFDASFSFICASRRQSRTDAAQTEVLKLDDPPYNSLTAGSSILAFPKVKIAWPSSPSQTSISAPDKILSLYLHSLHKRLLVRDQNVRPPPGARATLKVSLVRAVLEASKCLVHLDHHPSPTRRAGGRGCGPGPNRRCLRCPSHWQAWQFTGKRNQSLVPVVRHSGFRASRSGSRQQGSNLKCPGHS